MALRAKTYQTVSSGRDTGWASLASAGAQGGVVNVVSQGLANMAQIFLEEGRRTENKEEYDSGWQLGEQAAIEAFDSAAPLVLREDDSVESQAFNERALDVYMGRLDVSVNERMATLASEHRHDPEGFRDAISSMKPDILSRLPSDRREDVGQLFDAQASRQFMQIRAAAEKQAGVSYLARTNLEIEEKINQIEIATSDPGSYQEAIENLKGDFMQGIPAEMAEEVSLKFDLRASDGNRRVTKEYHSRLEDEQNGDLLTQAVTSAGSADRAWRSGDTDAATVAEMEWRTAIDARTDLTETRKAAMIAEREEERIRQSTLGIYERYHAGDPDRAAQYVADFRSEDHGLQPDFKAQLANEMDGLAADMRTEKKLAIRDLRAEAAVAVEAASKGRAFAGWEDLRARAADLGDLETIERMDDAKSIMREALAFAKLPPADMATRITDLRGRVKTDADNARLDALERVAKDAAKELDSDPVKYGIRNGISGLAPLDMSDPGGSVAQRIKAVDRFSERMGVAVPEAFTKQEAEAMTAGIDSLPTIDRAAVLGEMIGAAGPRANMVLSAIAKDRPEYAHAGAIFSRNPVVAADILAGSEIIQTNKQFVPTSRNWRDSYTASLPDGVLMGLDWDTQAGIERAVKALYVKRTADRNDTSGEVNSQALEAAIAHVTGGFVEYDADTTASVSSYSTVAPVPGMTSGEFTDLLDGLEDSDLPELPHTQLGEEISINDARRNGRLRFIGNGRYTIEFDRGQLALNGSGDGPYILDLSKIVGGE